MRRVVIAIDGGIAQFRFQIGSLAQISFGVGPHAPITIQEATPGALVAGNCCHNWFEAQIEEGGGNQFLSVQVITGADVSINFLPDRLAGYHVPANNNVVLNYTRDERENLRSEAQGLRAAAKK